MTELRACRRVTCGKKFAPGAADLLFCPRCREEILAQERASSLIGDWVSLSEATSSDARDVWDWQLLDEKDQLVWASDLARRYRHETAPRKQASVKGARGAIRYDRLAPTPETGGMPTS